MPCAIVSSDSGSRDLFSPTESRHWCQHIHKHDESNTQFVGEEVKHTSVQSCINVIIVH